MKKLLTAFVLLSTIIVVSCGKKNNNAATTPYDCNQYGMQPAYYGNNQWVQNGWNNGGWGNGYNNQWNNGYNSQWGNQTPWNNYNSGYNPYNVGCMYNNNGQFPTTYMNGQPYIQVEGSPCYFSISTQNTSCGVAGLRCYQTGAQMYRPGFQVGWQASWQIGGGYNPYNPYGQPAYYNGICARAY